MVKLGGLLIAVFYLNACALVNDVNGSVMQNGVAEESSQYQIILVRHFQKQTVTASSGRDVSLTNEGKENAENLAKHLRSKLHALSKVYSTNYRRTTQTANPSSVLFNLPIEHYNPAELDQFAKQLLANESTQLVVGHSNTTGVLYGLLGCHAHEIVEEDYGDVFIVTIQIKTLSIKSKNCEHYILD